jgi:hypothetical protein
MNSITQWLALWCVVIQLSGCASAELTQLAVNETADGYYRYIHLNVDLSDSADTVYLTNRLINKLDAYDLHIKASKQTQATQVHNDHGTALLKVEELERRIEVGEHHQTYGRTSLTRMRGRKKHEKPVITLRAMFIDTGSGQTLFQADYIMQGPWYADSTAVVAALADTLLDQLEHENYIAVKKQL